MLVTFELAYQLRDLVANDEDSFIDEASGWTLTRYEDRKTFTKHSNCAGKFLLGGFGILGSTYLGQSGQYFERTYTNIPTHRSVRFTMSLWMLDNWAPTDYFELSLDYNNYYKVYPNSPLNITFTSNVCGGSANDFPEYKIYGKSSHSSRSLILRFGTNLNQLSTTRSFGIRDINLLFASNTDSDTVTCPNPQATKFQCACTAGGYYYFNDCQSCDSACQICYDAYATQCYLCNSGYYFDGSTCNKCHSSCTVCSGPNPNQCIECNAGYVKFQGICRLPCASATDYLYENGTCYGECLSPRTIQMVGTAKFCLEAIVTIPTAPHNNNQPGSSIAVDIEIERTSSKIINESSETYVWIILGVSFGAGFILIALGIYFFSRRRKLLKKQVKPSQIGSAQELSDIHLNNIPSFARDIIERPPCISHMMEEFGENQYFDSPIAGERNQIGNHVKLNNITPGGNLPTKFPDSIL